MTRYGLALLLVLTWVLSCAAQPEYYADPFLGFPEFRVLPVRLPLSNPDSVGIDIHVRILFDDLQFIKDSIDYKAGYGLDVVLLDSHESPLDLNHVDRSVSVESYSLTNSRQLSDQTTHHFMVALQPVHLRVNLSDRETRKDRTLNKKIEFPEKEWGADLRLGDLVLLDSLGAVQLSSGFLRDQVLRVAYRLFCRGDSTASTEYQLVNERDQIVSRGQNSLTMNQPLFADTFKIPTAELPNGSYRFVLRSSSTSGQLMRYYPFKILWQDLPEFIQDLEMAIRQLKYIATDEEMDRLQTSPPSRRGQLFQDFWKSQDPTPATPINEKMEEYYRRVRYANEQFGGLRDGWETDMGRVYVIFGAPTDVERHPFDIDKKPHEYWYYYDLNRKFLFVDEDGFGEYRLKTPIWHDF